VSRRFPFDPGSVFDEVAEPYASHRPDYPQGLYDGIERLVGPLASRVVIDVGAGTGIASSALRERGARVTSIDPSASMLRVLRVRSGGNVAVGRGERLPIATGRADVITYAQAWHWVDFDAAAAEAVRCLRPGGWLLCWWNVSTEQQPWVQQVQAASGLWPYGQGDRQDDPARLQAVGGFSDIEVIDVPWHWRVPVERWVRAAGTRSSVASQRDNEERAIDKVRVVVSEAFPGGLVAESFTAHLVAARRNQAG
jgi:SAM-dependent methyltransferase